MKEKTKPSKVDLAPSAPREVDAVIVPATVIEALLKYLANKPWEEVNDLQYMLRTQLKPIFKNETENKSTPAA
jgi:hypothetical protein